MSGAVDIAINNLRTRADGQRMAYLKSRGAGHSDICIIDTSASIAWVVVQHPDVLKMRKKVKYVLLPVSSFPSVQHMTSRKNTIVYRPMTQRIYEVQYFRTHEATLWMQVLREHNLAKITRVASTQIPRGQRLIVKNIKRKLD